MQAMSRGIYPGEPYRAHTIELEQFLRERADSYIWGILKLFPIKYRNLRMERDRKILQQANKLELVQLVGLTSISTVINILPEGDLFASPTNGIVSFAEKYKILWVILIAIVGYSPLFKPWLLYLMCRIIPVLHYCHV